LDFEPAECSKKAVLLVGLGYQIMNRDLLARPIISIGNDVRSTPVRNHSFLAAVLTSWMPFVEEMIRIPPLEMDMIIFIFSKILALVFAQ
jgi:hypothetical protein